MRRGLLSIPLLPTSGLPTRNNFRLARHSGGTVTGNANVPCQQPILRTSRSTRRWQQAGVGPSSDDRTSRACGEVTPSINPSYSYARCWQELQFSVVSSLWNERPCFRGLCSGDILEVHARARSPKVGALLKVSNPLSSGRAEDRPSPYGPSVFLDSKVEPQCELEDSRVVACRDYASKVARIENPPRCRVHTST